VEAVYAGAMALPALGAPNALRPAAAGVAAGAHAPMNHAR
jgi:hypothetical protein